MLLFKHFLHILEIILICFKTMGGEGGVTVAVQSLVRDLPLPVVTQGEGSPTSPGPGTGSKCIIG